MDQTKTVKSVTRPTESLVFELAEDLARLVIQEHKLFQSELRQISKLADNAVQELSSASVKLQRSTDEIITAQHDLTNKTLEQTEKNLLLLSQKVNAATFDNVRVLQFEDILKQLTHHVLNRAGSMDALFSAIADELTNMKNLDAESKDVTYTIEQLRAHFDAMRNHIGHYKAALRKENPVKQDSMKTGNIEIF